jgi:response regulator NasT
MPDHLSQSPRLKAVLVDERPERRAELAATLDAFGCAIVGSASFSDDLIGILEAQDPDVVILDMEAPNRDMLESLATVNVQVPRPVVMFAQEGDSETIRRAVQAGVSAYVVDGIQPHRVRPIVEAAIARFEKFRALEDELQRTRAELADRKVIEKAKGLIMRQRGVSEDEAYRAMRKVAMRSNRRLADVAEGIVAAAELLI